MLNPSTTASVSSTPRQQRNVVIAATTHRYNTLFACVVCHCLNNTCNNDTNNSCNNDILTFKAKWHSVVGATFYTKLC